MKYLKNKYIITIVITILVSLATIVVSKIIDNKDSEIVEVEYLETVQLEENILYTSKDPIFAVKDSATDIEEDTEIYNGLEYTNNGKPYCIKVNRQQNVVTIYALDENNKYTVPIKAMVCSVGLNNATPTGSYTTYNRREWALLYGNVWGQYAYRIDGPIMFHSVPYYTKNKDDLKSAEFNKLGEAASQGCVRLSVLDAKWIYDNCSYGTIVEIFDSEYVGPLGKPTMEKIDLDSENASWDPTDSDKKNPWLEDNLPVIYGTKDITIERASEMPDLLSGIMAIDEDYNDCTADIVIEGDINNSRVGKYTIRYTIDSIGTELYREAFREVNVTVVDTTSPEIVELPQSRIITVDMAASDNLESILLEGVVAKDSGETMVLGSVYVSYNDIAGKNVGEYFVKYVAIDEVGNRSEVKTVAIKIID